MATMLSEHRTPDLPRNHSESENTTLIRAGLESLSTQGDLTAIGMLFMKDMIQCMHSGKIREAVEAWMTKDTILKSKNMPYTMDTKGHEEWLNTYNAVIMGHYGSPDANMEFRLDKAEEGKKNQLCIDMTVTTTGKKNMVESTQVAIQFTGEYSVSELLVTSLDHPATLPSPTFDRPCLHNLWDSVRTKKGVALLRCRTCVSQWKLPASTIIRCKKFVTEAGCFHGAACTSLHIHARKKSYE
eukprot:TRINITY_DN181_c0_g1_i10.p1 TRINITY_DN181_c0_g1~~TRINITY_DN181_c0_g1_i10.p1  ORF type:complete len:242 (+),score=37.76 TRINITY_DN181_c0_g1_i10:116-841(+)